VRVGAHVPLRFPTSRAVEGMERRALAVPYPLIVEEHALRRASEAQDVPKHLNARRRGQETSTGGRRADVVWRERDALEDAVDAALGVAADVRELVELHEEVVTDRWPSPVRKSNFRRPTPSTRSFPHRSSPRPGHGLLRRRARGVVRAHGVSREGQRQV
jgi:hypothetical protein